MGFLPFFQWGLILQALAVVHFIRRRPDTFWLYVIIFLGGLGAFVYILVEVVPDLGLLRHVLDAQGRRKRIRQLEAVVLENPSIGNWEELGDSSISTRRNTRVHASATTRPFHRGPFTPTRSIAAVSPRFTSETSRPPSPIWKP